MTKQEYLDKLYVSAINGTFPGWNAERRVCCYRGDRTPACKSRCAIGLLIPDDKYTDGGEHIEETAVESLVICGAVTIPEGMTESDMHNVREAHDETAIQKTGWSPVGFATRLRALDCFTNCIHIGV